MKGNKLSFVILFLIVLTLLCTFVIAAEGTPTAAEKAFKENPSPENFNKLTNPTAANLRNVKTPTLDNFKSLEKNNPQQAADYLVKYYDEKFAHEFFSKASNLGVSSSSEQINQRYFSKNSNIKKNLAVADKFFSGNYKVSKSTWTTGAQSIRNVNNHKKQFDYLLETKYRITNVVTEHLESDFAYIPGTTPKLRNGGWTLPLGSYADSPGILKISLIKKDVSGFSPYGIKIDTQNGPVKLGGSDKAEMAYDRNKKEFNIKTNDGTKYKLHGKKPKDKVTEVTIVLDEKKGFSTTGPSEVTAEVKGIVREIKTRSGVTVVNPNNGEVKTDDGIYNERNGRVYWDGKAKIITDSRSVKNQHAKIQVVANSYNGKETGVTSKPSGITAVTSGHSADKKQFLTVNMGVIDPKKTNGLPAMTKKEVAAQNQAAILAAKKPRKDVGKNTVVNINEDLGAKRVNADIHGPGQLLHSVVDNFNGVVGNDPSKFQVTTLEGDSQASYTRDQSFEIGQCRGRCEGGNGDARFESKQKGSAFKFSSSPIKANAVIYESSCESTYTCKGTLASVKQRVSVVKTISETYGLTREIDHNSLQVDFTQTDKGVVTSINRNDLGKLADRKKDDLLAMSKDVFFRDSSGGNLLGMTADGIGKYETTTDKKGQKTYTKKSTTIDLNAKLKTGQQIIVLSDREKQDVNKLLTLIKAGRFDSVSDNKLVLSNPDVRRVILEETGIDTFAVNNKEYMAKIGKAKLQIDGSYLVYRQQLSKQGIDLKPDGTYTCQPNCNALEKQMVGGGELAKLLLTAKGKLFEGKITSMEADLIRAKALGINGLAIKEQKDELTRRLATDVQAQLNVWKSTEQVKITLERLSVLSDPDYKKVSPTVAKLGTENKKLQAQIKSDKQTIAVYLKQIELRLEGVQCFATECAKQAGKFRNHVEALKKQIKLSEQTIDSNKGQVSDIARKFVKNKPELAIEICLQGNSDRCIGNFAEELKKQHPARAQGLEALYLLKDDFHFRPGVEIRADSVVSESDILTPVERIAKARQLLDGFTDTGGKKIPAIKDLRIRQRILAEIDQLEIKKGEEVERAAYEAMVAAREKVNEDELCLWCAYGESPSRLFSGELENRKDASDAAVDDWRNKMVYNKLRTKGFSATEIEKMSGDDVVAATGLVLSSGQTAKFSAAAKKDPDLTQLKDLHLGQRSNDKVIAASLNKKADRLDKVAGNDDAGLSLREQAVYYHGDKTSAAKVEAKRTEFISKATLYLAFDVIADPSAALPAGKLFKVGKTIITASKTYNKLGKVKTGLNYVGKVVKGVNDIPSKGLGLLKYIPSSKGAFTAEKAVAKAFDAEISLAKAQGLAADKIKKLESARDIYQDIKQAEKIAVGVQGLRKNAYYFNKESKKAKNSLDNLVGQFKDLQQRGKYDEAAKLAPKIKKENDIIVKNGIMNALDNFFEKAEEIPKARREAAKQALLKFGDDLPDGNRISSVCNPNCRVQVIDTYGEEVTSLTEKYQKQIKSQGFSENSIAKEINNIEVPTPEELARIKAEQVQLEARWMSEGTSSENHLDTVAEAQQSRITSVDRAIEDVSGGIVPAQKPITSTTSSSTAGTLVDDAVVLPTPAKTKTSSKTPSVSGTLVDDAVVLPSAKKSSATSTTASGTLVDDAVVLPSPTKTTSVDEAIPITDDMVISTSKASATSTAKPPPIPKAKTGVVDELAAARAKKVEADLAAFNQDNVPRLGGEQYVNFPEKATSTQRGITIDNRRVQTLLNELELEGVDIVILQHQNGQKYLVYDPTQAFRKEGKISSDIKKKITEANKLVESGTAKISYKGKSVSVSEPLVIDASKPLDLKQKGFSEIPDKSTNCIPAVSALARTGTATGFNPAMMNWVGSAADNCVRKASATATKAATSVVTSPVKVTPIIQVGTPPVKPKVVVSETTSVKAPSKEALDDVERLDLGSANAPSPTSKQISEGQKLHTESLALAQAEVALKQGKLSPEEFQKLVDQMYTRATLDSHGAVKLPVFESNLPSDYTLFEVSMPRSVLKKLNGQSYEIGTKAISAQHQELIKFAKKNGLQVTTNQKTTFIAIPKGSTVTQADVAKFLGEAQSAVKKATGETVQLRVGIAEGKSSNLMEARLKTRRSMQYSDGRTAPVKYGNDVETWYKGLKTEVRSPEGQLIGGKAFANDIFRGYDAKLTAEFQELEKLRIKAAGLKSKGGADYEKAAAAYRKKSIQLAETDLQDANFRSLEVSKSYQADKVTGIQQGDLMVSIDGVSVGKLNQEDAVKISGQGLSDDKLGRVMGADIDNKIATVNEQMRVVYDSAVDRIINPSTSTLAKYNKIAKASGRPVITNAAELKSFLKWEFKNKLRFRGGDETFMVLRSEVVNVDPKLAQNIQTKIKQCGKNCGYEIRVGVKEIKTGESFPQAIAASDKAVGISKELGNVPVKVDMYGQITATGLDMNKFKLDSGRIRIAGTQQYLSLEATKIVRKEFTAQTLMAPSNVKSLSTAGAGKLPSPVTVLPKIELPKVKLAEDIKIRDPTTGKPRAAVKIEGDIYLANAEREFGLRFSGTEDILLLDSKTGKYKKVISNELMTSTDVNKYIRVGSDEYVMSGKNIYKKSRAETIDVVGSASSKDFRLTLKKDGYVREQPGLAAKPSPFRDTRPYPAPSKVVVVEETKKVTLTGSHAGNYVYDPTKGTYTQQRNWWFDKTIKKGDPEFISLEAKRLGKTEAEIKLSIENKVSSAGCDITLPATVAKAIYGLGCASVKPVVKRTTGKVTLTLKDGRKYESQLLDYQGNLVYYDLEKGWQAEVKSGTIDILDKNLIDEFNGVTGSSDIKIINKGTTIDLRNPYTPRGKVEDLVGQEVILADGTKKTLGQHIGTGGVGDVYCLEVVPPCKTVIKFPHSRFSNAERSKEIFEEEAAITKTLEAAGIDVAKIHTSNNPHVIIKDYVQGKSLEEIVRGGEITQTQIDELVDLWSKARKNNIQLDANTHNFIWIESERKWKNIDAGPRGHPGNDWQVRLEWLPEEDYNKIMKVKPDPKLGENPLRIPVSQAEKEKVLAALKESKSSGKISPELEDLLEGFSPQVSGQYQIIGELEKLAPTNPGAGEKLFTSIDSIMDEAIRLVGDTTVIGRTSSSQDISTAIRKAKNAFAKGDAVTGEAEYAKALKLADERSLILGSEIRAKYGLGPLDKLAADVKTATKGNDVVYTLKGKEFIYDSSKGWVKYGVDEDLSFVLKKEDEILTAARNKVELKKLKAKQTSSVEGAKPVAKKKVETGAGCDLPASVAAAIYGMACGSTTTITTLDSPCLLPGTTNCQISNDYVLSEMDRTGYDETKWKLFERKFTYDPKKGIFYREGKYPVSETSNDFHQLTDMKLRREHSVKVIQHNEKLQKFKSTYVAPESAVQAIEQIKKITRSDFEELDGLWVSNKIKKRIKGFLDKREQAIAKGDYLQAIEMETKIFSELGERTKRLQPLTKQAGYTPSPDHLLDGIMQSSNPHLWIAYDSFKNRIKLKEGYRVKETNLLTSGTRSLSDFPLPVLERGVEQGGYRVAALPLSKTESLVLPARTISQAQERIKGMKAIGNIDPKSTKVKSLLEQRKTALQNGNYKKARELDYQVFKELESNLGVAEVEKRIKASGDLYLEDVFESYRFNGDFKANPDVGLLDSSKAKELAASQSTAVRVSLGEVDEVLVVGSKRYILDVETGNWHPKSRFWFRGDAVTDTEELAGIRKAFKKKIDEGLVFEYKGKKYSYDPKGTTEVDLLIQRYRGDWIDQGMWQVDMDIDSASRYQQALQVMEGKTGSQAGRELMVGKKVSVKKKALPETKKPAQLESGADCKLLPAAAGQAIYGMACVGELPAVTTPKTKVKAAEVPTVKQPGSDVGELAIPGPANIPAEWVAKSPQNAWGDLTRVRGKGESDYLLIGERRIVLTTPTGKEINVIERASIELSQYRQKITLIDVESGKRIGYRAQFMRTTGTITSADLFVEPAYRNMGINNLLTKHTFDLNVGAKEFQTTYDFTNKKVFDKYLIDNPGASRLEAARNTPSGKTMVRLGWEPVEEGGGGLIIFKKNPKANVKIVTPPKKPTTTPSAAKPAAKAVSSTPVAPSVTQTATKTTVSTSKVGLKHNFGNRRLVYDPINARGYEETGGVFGFLTKKKAISNLDLEDLETAHKIRVQNAQRYIVNDKTYVYDSTTKTWKQKRWYWTDKIITERDSEFKLLQTQRNKVILSDFGYDGNQIMGALSEEFPDLKLLFAADAGVGEGYTIQQHTKMVFDLYEAHKKTVLASIVVPKGMDLEKLMPAMIALHDIGKPQAIAKGAKHLQHQHTLPILENTLKKLGFSKAEIDLAKNLVSHDTLGSLAIGKISTLEAFQKMKTLAKSSGMNSDDFLKLQQLFFTSDAASYAFVRQQSFVQKGGLLVPKSQNFDTLRKMMEMSEVDEFSKITPTALHSWVTEPLEKKSVLGVSTAAGEVGDIPSCCYESSLFQIPEILKADTLPGAIDKIRLAQKAGKDTELGKAYLQLRSSNPQTFSKKTLEEIVENLDHMLENNFVHGTNYRILPSLKRTKEKIGSPALIPTGVLQESGLAASAGELGIGVVGAEAHNKRLLSGISYYDSNLDTTYHYARLKGGYDIQVSQSRISKLENALAKYHDATTPAENLRDLQGEIRSLLHYEFDIFDTRLLFGREIETAKTTLQREKTFLQQAKGYSPLEIKLMKEGKPIIITDDRIVAGSGGGRGNIRGEINLEGRIDLTNPDVGIFVERAEIPEIRKYLQEELGIKNPNVMSIEAYDLINSILDSYRMKNVDGTIMSPERLRLELKNDPDGLRIWLKQQLKNYIAAMK